MAQSVLTQEELIERAGRGDEAAFEALYRETAPRLFAIALRMTGQHAAAEDVLHEAYVAVWRSAARFDARRGSARAWLGTILRRKAIDRLRASPWLERAIDAEALPAIERAIAERNPWTDVLNLIQIELLSRQRAGGGDEEELREAIQSTINGIAAAMQSTG